MEAMTHETKNQAWRDVYSSRERAEEYQALLRLAGGKWHLDMLGAAVQALAFLGTRPEDILELGVGTGKLSSRVLRRYPRVRLHGVDGSRAMLAKARRNLASAGAGRVRYLWRDFGASEWPRGIPRVDAVISTIAIHHLTDAGKKRLYAQVLGLLKPGGIFINGDAVWAQDPVLKERDDFMWATYIQDRHKRLHRRDKPVAEIVRWINETRDAEGDMPASLERQLGWLRGAGYAHVDCYWKNFGFAVFGGMKPGAGA